MHTEIVTIHISSDWKGLKRFDKQLIDLFIAIIFIQNLFSESKMLCHGSWLVVSSKHNNVLRINDFECIEEYWNLDRVVSTIDVVSKNKGAVILIENDKMNIK